MTVSQVLIPAALAPVIALAQPQGDVLWRSPGDDGIYSTIAVADVNGDSSPEVVAAIYYGGTPSDPRKAYCLSGRTGDTVWVNRSAYGTWGNKGLDHTPDLNSDGVGDVLLGTVGTYIPPGRSCAAIDGATGDTLWVFPFGQERGWCYSVRTFVTPDGNPVDLDGDSVPDVLAGAGGVTSDRRGTAIALSGATGDSLWAFRPDYDGVQCLAPFVDVDGDTVPDVLVGAGGNGYDNRAFCVSGRTGTPLWNYTTGNSVSDIERIPDVNASGTDDVICGGWAYKVYCLEGSTGDSLWATSLGTGNIVMEVVRIRDTNSDGVDDVVVGSWESSIFVLSGADGAVLWSGFIGNDVWSVDTLADVTGDGIPEVVGGCLGNGNGVVKVFSGADGAPLWYYNFSERVYDVTGMPDLNADGRPDVVVGLQDQGHDPDHVYAFSGVISSGVAAGTAPRPTAIVRPVFGRGLSLAAPHGVGWRLTFADRAGRAVGPALHGLGSGRPETVSLAAALPTGLVFARLELNDGTRQTTKLIIANQRKAALR